MTDEEWERIAGRIASTWPTVPVGADDYRDDLRVLEADDVAAAIDAMLLEHRAEPPSPGALGRRAREEAAYGGDPPVPIEHLPDDDAEPRPSSLSGRRESGRATASLILGVAGLLVLPLVCSVLAIRLATQARGEIAADPGLGGAERARLGLVLGWVGLGVFALALIAGIVIAVTAS